jgi:hypothetical protein
MKTLFLLLLATSCCFAEIAPTPTQTSPEALGKATTAFLESVRPLLPPKTANGHIENIQMDVDLLDRGSQILHVLWMQGKRAQKSSDTGGVKEWLQASLETTKQIKQLIEDISKELARKNIEPANKAALEKLKQALLTEADKYLADLNAGRFP